MNTDYHKRFVAHAFFKEMKEDGEYIPMQLDVTDDDEVYVSWNANEGYECFYFSLSQLLNYLSIEGIGVKKK